MSKPPFLSAHKTGRRRTLTRTALAILVPLLLVATAVAAPTLAPVDLANYIAGTKILLQGQDPYGVVEFFFPPWAVTILWPFATLPLGIAASAWLLLAATSQVAQGSIALAATVPTPSTVLALACRILPALMPAAFFSYVTGQISPIVGLAAAVVLGAGARFHPLAIGFSVAIALLKPQITIIPISLGLMEVARAGNWRLVALVGGVLALLVGLAYLALPSWPTSLFNAWLAGSYRGGPGLVAEGYRGLLELGVPYWMLLPALAYTIWSWLRDHLSPRTVALAFATGLLLAPYSRAYDHVLLAFPLVVGLAATAQGRHLAATIVTFSSLVLPATSLWVLAPPICLVGLALTPHSKRRNDHGA